MRAQVAIHSGGYAKNGEDGFAPSYEMRAACQHFAARGWVAITMVYRMSNRQTGGALAPANWSVSSPLTSSWKGGFRPTPQTIWPAVRDTKAAIRWLRAQAGVLNIDTEYLASGGWSAGASTSTFLVSTWRAENDRWRGTVAMAGRGDTRCRCLCTRLTTSGFHARAGVTARD